MMLLDLFLTFFKIGITTFGGGYAMIPLIQSEVVGKSWLSETALVNFIAVSESTPGPFAINIATYVGRIVGGIWGSVFATLGVVLPSFIVILIVSKFYKKFRENRAVQGCMTGLRPAVIGLIGSALISMVKTVFFADGFAWQTIITMANAISLVIFGIVFYLAIIKKMHPIIVILISALLGIISGYGQTLFI